ncbi:ATP synthase epsilon chain [Candidatus Syntrophocurvum alkaliphilum]|uniref:ATP synthase epsilon chain n=1 Tax=Candidatus Syntrophocurvum alkaliphilum TaxID=2293317 RepID=A0A6I6DE29_9FIRM|nr:F0F1 ATP synthase subunit epsilon [Candidatus Syntrophocurvum alkaliphilum]QGU00732.1 ATP synthase epsilon chain [Candidatus Syntrophocurvum alkaliphilum]
MAENTFMLEIVTPEQILYKDEIQLVVAPAVEGELGVMKNHAPLVAALNIGVVRFKDGNGNQQRVAISGGLIEVIDNSARILAETAEKGEDIDVVRAKSAKERAENRLSQRDDSLNYTRAQTALQRAITRLKAAEAKID